MKLNNDHKEIAIAISRWWPTTSIPITIILRITDQVAFLVSNECNLIDNAIRNTLTPDETN